MRQKIFLNLINQYVSKCVSGLGVFNTRVAYRLRGVGRYAQDTVPIRACFLYNTKGLRTLGSVSPSVTVWEVSENLNKNSAGARHG